MTDPRRVEELYHAALELPEDEREALLSEACGSDTALLAGVRSLLGDAEQARHLLDRPVAEAATERLAVAPGTRLSHYEIGERIGAGGMGEVYRARDPRLERDVAVKVLRGDVAADPERQRRFQREARAASALSHPNVLAVYDVGAENGVAFVVSELLEGQTLRERLRDGSLTPRKSVEIAAQVAAGLAAAHAKGIAHRDLKPENVVLTREGVAKILDFGLARLTQVNPPAGPAPSAGTSSVTASGALLGTAAYMSPEQARGSRADHRSDIFSLGIVLYEMLARAHPFRGETAAETLVKILREDPAPLAERAVPGPLAHVVHRCLEKRPEDRFESAHDLGLALGAALEPGAVPARRAPPARPARVGRLAAAATLAGAAAALALVALLRAPPRPAVGEIRQITHDGRLKAVRPTGGQFHTSLVSDGSRVYFSELSAAPRSALVAGGGVESVSGALPSREPFTLVGDISPDGGELLLEAALSSQYERPLWIWPLAGGAPRRLGGLVGHSPAFAPGGERIAYASGEEIRLASRDGAPSTRLASVEGRPFALRWSPDGGRLRFSVSHEGGLSLWEVSARGGPPRPVLHGWREPALECCGSWTADGRHYVFEGHHGSRVDLWAVRDAPGGAASQPVRLTAGPLSYRLPTPSPDGRQLFAVGVYKRGELMRYDLETERLEPFLGGLSAEQLDFSPDGEWVAYLTYPQESVWRSRVDGSERLQLTPPEMRAALPRWSPDGRRIALAAAVRGRRWQTHVVDADGGGLEPLVPADARGVEVSWAPDGRRLAFADWSHTGLLDLATREVTPLPGPGGSPVFSPRWSPDGRYLAAMSHDSSALLLYEFETGSWTRLVEGHVGWPTWTRDGRRLCFDYAEPGTTNVGGRDARSACLRVPDGPLERLAVIRGARRASGRDGAWLGFAPDGSPLVLRDHGTQDVYALEWIAPGE